MRQEEQPVSLLRETIWLLWKPGYSGMNRLFVNFQKDSRTNPEYVTAGVRKKKKKKKKKKGGGW
ncbi:hypothetical protein A4V08_28680 [Lachnoclostridium sp. YL32]|nr:hypothetical protein A4V08_28680 [Lachnoclostridium sp. YL32]